MSDPRRYTEREIAAIFEKATQAQEQAQRSIEYGEGLTVEELQAIGREAGIAPDFVARAAASLKQDVARIPPRTLFGMPVGVERKVDLPGPLSDQAWDRLVVDLRETFQATGQVRQDGSIRTWRNGNLRAYVEPTATGYRLRLSTRKGNAPQTLTLSAFFLVMGVLFLSLLVTQGNSEAGMIAIMSLFAATGVGGIGYTALSLPRWAAERGRQMEAVIERVLDREAEQVQSAVSDGVVDASAVPSRIDLESTSDGTDATVPTSRSRLRA